jgi:hypothetical protein
VGVGFVANANTPSKSFQAFRCAFQGALDVVDVMDVILHL